MKRYKLYVTISGHEEPILSGIYVTKELAVKDYKRLTGDDNFKKAQELKDNECLEITLMEENYPIVEESILKKKKYEGGNE